MANLAVGSMKRLSRALKEWSAVVDALGSGLQTILIRKYPPAHRDFLLYPTYGFSARKIYLDRYYQKHHHDFVKKSVESKKKGKTNLRYYANVTEVIEVKRANFDRLRNLTSHYVWSPNHVVDYLKDEKYKTAYIWLVRVHKLQEPQSINDLGRGALRYANLPISVSIASKIPVLNDPEFQFTVNEIKRNLERVPPISLDIQKLQEALLERESKIQELQKTLHEKEERIKQLETTIGPSPIDIIISKLTNISELSPEDFEWTLKQTFEILGFEAKWNGELKDEKPLQTAPQGKPDVEVKAPLAGDPYFIVVEVTKMVEERYQVTEVHGAVDHSKIFPGLPYKTCYRLLIAPRFRKGAIEACNKMGLKYSVMLLTCQDLIEIIKFHSEVGGVTQEELKHLFDELEGRGKIRREHIEVWEKTVREQREKLSLALTVYDILYLEKDFMWPRDIWRELKKKRRKEDLPSESLQGVHDVLKILETIGALIVKPSPDGDIEKYNYKAGLTPEGFRLRIRKLEETVRLHESKQPARLNKLTSWVEK